MGLGVLRLSGALHIGGYDRFGQPGLPATSLASNPVMFTSVGSDEWDIRLIADVAEWSGTPSDQMLELDSIMF